MTLVMSVQTPRSIWMVTDQRLSAGKRIISESAVKTARVAFKDGEALFGYTGIGSTALGNQPSQWVVNVLRGRRVPLEQGLQLVTDALIREFPPHLDKIQEVEQRQHSFLIPAFVENKVRFYTIDIVSTPDGYKYRYIRHIRGDIPECLQIVTPIQSAGSGEMALNHNQDWVRPTLRLLKAYNRKKVSPDVVANHLAQVAYYAHKNTEDGTVGPNCSVTWKNSISRFHKGGGSSQFFSDAKRTLTHPNVPTVLMGLDLQELAEVLLPHHAKMVKAMRDKATTEANESNQKEDASKETIQIPSIPDEKFR